MIEEKSSGGIVFRKHAGGYRILLIRDRFGYWTWPKGHIEEGETPVDTAYREISEETGLKDLDIAGEAGKQEYTFLGRDKEQVSKSVDIFIVINRTEEELVPQLSEISEVRWFSEQKAMDVIGYEGSKKILENAIRLYKEKYCEQ